MWHPITLDTVWHPITLDTVWHPITLDTVWHPITLDTVWHPIRLTRCDIPLHLTRCDIPLDCHGVTSHYTWHGVTSHYTWLSISTAVWTPNIVKFEKSLCARHRCMWSGGINPRFLNRAVDGGEWSTVHPGRLSSRKSLHITLSLRSLIAYRANLNSLKKKNLFYGCQKSNHGSPVVKPLP